MDIASLMDFSAHGMILARHFRRCIAPFIDVPSILIVLAALFLCVYFPSVFGKRGDDIFASSQKMDELVERMSDLINRPDGMMALAAKMC